jgi:glutamate-1-semialdehyde 2,1-aminomutase
MNAKFWLYFILMTVGLYLLRKLQIRLRLSRAKHPSLRGHSKISRLIAKRIPFYEYNEKQFFSSDGAPPTVAQQRQAGFARLNQQFSTKSPKSIALSQDLESSISDVVFTNAYRVPYQ